MGFMGFMGVISIVNGDYKATLVGGLNPSENISQLGKFFPIYGKKCSKPPTSIVNGDHKQTRYKTKSDKGVPFISSYNWGYHQHWISISPPGRGKGAPQRVLTKKTAKATCFFCFFPGGMRDVEQMSIRISGYFRLLQFSGILSDVKSAKVGILLEVLVLFFDVFRSLKGLNILNLLTLVDHFWLVVSIPLKNMKVSWDDYSQYMEK